MGPEQTLRNQVLNHFTSLLFLLKIADTFNGFKATVRIVLITPGISFEDTCNNIASAIFPKLSFVEKEDFKHALIARPKTITFLFNRNIDTKQFA